MAQILVVDDDYNIIEVVEMYLEGFGHKVTLRRRVHRTICQQLDNHLDQRIDRSKRWHRA